METKFNTQNAQAFNKTFNKNLNKTYVATLLAAGLSVSAYVLSPDNAFANTNQSQAQAKSQNQKQVQTQVDKLEKEVEQLQQQVKDFKSQDKSKNKSKNTDTANSNNNNNKSSQPVFGFAYNHNADVNGVPHPQSAAFVVQNKSKVPYQSALFGAEAQFDQQVWNGSSEYQGDNGGVKNNGAGNYVSVVIFNTFVNVNKWVSAYFRFEAAGDQLQPSFSNAFVTVGNFDYSPFYASFGQNYLPVGAFNADGGPYSNGVDSDNFSAGSSYQQVDFGYYKNGFNAQFAVFKDSTSDSSGNPKSSGFNDFATSVYYQSPTNKFFSYNVGAGYVKDFKFTAASWAQESVGDASVPVANVNGSVTFNQNFTVSAEYNQATTSNKYNYYDGNDKDNKTKSGKPASWTFGTSYSPTVFGKATTFFGSYSQAKDMNGFATPEGGYGGQYADPYGFKSSYNFAVTRPVFYDKFFVSLDYQKAKDYNNKTSNVFTVDETVEF